MQIKSPREHKCIYVLYVSDIAAKKASHRVKYTLFGTDPAFLHLTIPLHGKAYPKFGIAFV